MFYIYILHCKGADKIMEFTTEVKAVEWVNMQIHPDMFYVVNWGM